MTSYAQGQDALRLRRPQHSIAGKCDSEKISRAKNCEQLTRFLRENNGRGLDFTSEAQRLAGDEE